MNKVVADKPARQRFRGPSIRRRFVTRAATVRTEPLFLREIEDTRRTWNQAHPQFALELPDWAPDPLPAGHPFMVFPREVEPFVNSTADVPEAIQQAGGHWAELALEICDAWWPLQLGYHNWLAGYLVHPASLFVSSCLIWRPDSVSEELISVGNLGPQPLPFDPREESAHPGARYWQMYAATLAKLIDDAIAAGGTIDGEWRTRAARAASQVAWMERAQTFRRRPDEVFWYLPLFPGITTSDGDEIVRNIHLVLTGVYGDDPVRDIARRLKAEGLSDANIARLVGVSTKTVARWLQSS